jgi:hypothetical protein
MKGYAQGGVVEGTVPAELMVRHLEGKDYREYWDPGLKRWVRILSPEQVREYNARALDALNEGLHRG